MHVVEQLVLFFYWPVDWQLEERPHLLLVDPTENLVVVLAVVFFTDRLAVILSVSNSTNITIPTPLTNPIILFVSHPVNGIVWGHSTDLGIIHPPVSTTPPSVVSQRFRVIWNLLFSNKGLSCGVRQCCTRPLNTHWGCGGGYCSHRLPASF